MLGTLMIVAGSWCIAYALFKQLWQRLMCSGVICVAMGFYLQFRDSLLQ